MMTITFGRRSAAVHHAGAKHKDIPARVMAIRTVRLVGVYIEVYS
ncbi:hypothetical protein [Aeoliella mucimassa]|nr:hypothetical protein [Aeoliella mucimassa]